MHSEFTSQDESGSLFQRAFQSTGGPSDSTDQGRRKAYAKGSYTTLKLRSNPADDNSPIYEIHVPYFKSGTCEQFLELWTKFKP